jgi:uncharacterized protein YqeY
MKAAMKARETERLNSIRLLMAAIKQKEVDDRITLDDAAVKAAISQTGAAGPADMGKVMGILKPQLAGKTDLAAVSQRVKAALQG